MIQAKVALQFSYLTPLIILLIRQPLMTKEDMIYIPLQQELIRFYMSKVQVKNGKQKTPMEDLMVDTSKK